MIEIYHYEPQDIEMRFNKWAWPYKSKRKLAVLKKILAERCSYTLFDTKIDEPVAILCFWETKPDCYYGMIIASDKFGNNPKYAVKMRYLIGCVKYQYGAKEVESISEDAPDLNKWHEFLGFKLIEKLPKYYKGRDFILWRM